MNTPTPEVPYPPYKFATNLNPGELFYPPGADGPMAVSDTTRNRGLRHQGRDVLVVDSDGAVHPMWGSDQVRMYWPQQAMEEAALRAEAEQCGWSLR